MPEESSAAPLRQPTSPAARLWRRYRKAPGARLGMTMVACFSLVAFLAPFLAHRLPFYWHDAATGQTTWPLIREFFAPSDTTEPLLEKGINFLFLFIPAALAAWWAMNRFWPRLARMDSRHIALLFGAMLSASIWLAIGGMVIQGGGKDWFYSETAPVPEVDDITDDLIFGQQHTSAAAALIDAKLRERGIQRTKDAAVTLNDPTDSSNKNAPQVIASHLQALIDGPPLAPVDEFASQNGIDTHGINDRNLSLGINAARWNRLLVEAAYPGLLVPMRQFRSSFLLLALVSLLTLLGLTYIFMAGANQFTLSPRWLVLLLLAAVMLLPFRHPVHHDHTPYRQLAAEEKGTGVFPPIPYGPNEQGFGPRLPPFWAVESPLLTMEKVRSWDALRKALASPAGDLGKWASESLTQTLPDWRQLTETSGGQEKVLAAMNRIIESGAIPPAEATQSLQSDLSLRPYLAAVQSGKTPAAVHLSRMDRLLLEKAAPGAFVPANAVRWKKPNHVEGVHVFGTDESGRDVLVRILHGARVSLSVGFVSVFLATVIGLVMGSLAAYYGGKIDILISRFIEIMMCFPSFFLILAVIAVLDKRSIINIMLVIGITSWTGVARLIRGEMLRQKKMDYVSASIALGAPDTRTIFRQILPNAMAPVLVSISFGITGAILTEASLSFIGFGVTPPTPTWGQLLSETRDSPLANWWLAVFPGVVLFVSVLAYNMVGEAIRDALDPRTNL